MQEEPVQNASCEFCKELLRPKTSRFAKIYGPKVESRVVASAQGFVAIPTLGQLFKGSLLVLPTDHYEMMSQLPREMRSALECFIKGLEQKLMPIGLSVLFEHGARSSTGASCGIYHAHIHIVPVPGNVRYQDFLPEGELQENLSEIYSKAGAKESYLYFRGTDRSFGFYAGHDMEKYPSQYFRRGLAKHFEVQHDWDWRNYDSQEEKLLETLAWFKGDNVSVLS
jgi:diadenosine tetraphosphate (Ap4A) HIT family hydrolase